MELYYGVKDKPKFGQLLVFALQQLLAVLAATIVVPVIINGNVNDLIASGDVTYTMTPMSSSAALFGAGIGTLVYLLFTKFKSPVFLGSSFAFLGSMTAAFSGAVSASAGYTGLIVGAFLAGLVYVIIAILVKKVGTAWLEKLMPAVVIGPTVAIIGLSLAGNAVGDLKSAVKTTNWAISLLCGNTTLLVTIICSVYGKKTLKMIPFIAGISAGYILASIFTGFGYIFDVEWLKVIDFTKFSSMKWIPDFTFIEGFKGIKEFTWVDFGRIAIAYIPVAFVVFAEHVADHKNLSSIINSDLLKDPGLDRTLLGDGVGSMVGAFFGGACNTTYGESIGCVAISGNASVRTILTTAILAILASFFAPFTTLLSTIPSCVMGGVCVALYGFIAVSGLKMIQGVDLSDNKNLFVVSVILIAGVGGLTLNIGKVTITEVACALILGIIVNTICNIKKKN